MRLLLKIFIPDFLKQALWTLIAVFIGAVIISSLVGGEDIEDKWNTLYMVIFTLTFIAGNYLHFTNFPLVKNSNWILLTPLSKLKIISFNATFHLLKFSIFFIIFAVLILLVDYFNNFYLLNNSVETVFLIYNSLSSSHGKFIINGSTDAISNAILFLSILPIFFSTGIAQRILHPNNNPTFRHVVIKNRLKRYKYFIGATVGLTSYALIAHDNFFRSSAFLRPLLICSAFYILFFSYNSELKIFNSKKTQKIMLGFVALFFIIYIAGISYSNFRIYSKNTTVREKLTEIRYQDVFFTKLTIGNLKQFLMIPLTPTDIKYLQKKYQQFSKRINSENYKILDIKDFDFKKSIAAQTDHESILYIMDLIKIDRLSVRDIEWIIDNYKSKYKSSELPRDFHQRLKKYPFSNKLLTKYISSNDSFRQQIGIAIIGIKRNFKLAKTLLENVFTYDNDTLYYATEIVTDNYCRSLSSAFTALQNPSHSIDSFDNCPKSH